MSGQVQIYPDNGFFPSGRKVELEHKKKYYKT
jgi:hypothetical protein